MKKVFADTAYFLALLNRDDAFHGEALRVTDQWWFHDLAVIAVGKIRHWMRGTITATIRK